MLDEIKKHLRKKNKNLSDKKINKQAELIWQAYCDTKQERDKNRKETFKKAWDIALQKENDQIALEYLSGEELLEYFRGGKNEERFRPEVVTKSNVKIENGYLYFIQCRKCSQKKYVSKKCTSPDTHYYDIWRKKMTIGSGESEFVAEVGIHKEIGYMYYINLDGNILRVKTEN